MKALSSRERLLALYELFPFHRHPLWRAVLSHDLGLEQIINAEVQHYLRTRAGQHVRREALERAQAISPAVWEALLDTYLEECTDTVTPSHLELIKRLVLSGGVTADELAKAQPTLGNTAAIALYREIASRGAACHLLGAGAVEYYYSDLAPRVFKVYTEHYGMSSEQAETYRLHGPLDRTHANRAFAIVDEAVALHGWELVEASVRDAFLATSLHYDGMLQAALGRVTFWDGRAGA
jgi:pyrroloquinoline quinone (PQQ) biosynthesis protein C